VIAEAKMRPGLVWWGVFLGWVGVAVAAFMPPGIGRSPVRCPHCLTLVPRQATRCAHCASELGTRAVSP
jgi:hypothetical protein